LINLLQCSGLHQLAKKGKTKRRGVIQRTGFEGHITQVINPEIVDRGTAGGSEFDVPNRCRHRPRKCKVRTPLHPQTIYLPQVHYVVEVAGWTCCIGEGGDGERKENNQNMQETWRFHVIPL
jgi:hypothetical protein